MSSLLGIGTVLRLERDAWSRVTGLRQAANEDAPPSPLTAIPSRPKLTVALIRVFLPPGADHPRPEPAATFVRDKGLFAATPRELGECRRHRCSGGGGATREHPQDAGRGSGVTVSMT